MTDRLELEFKRWLKKHWRGWSSSVEYALGGDAGFPDQVFLVGGAKLLPVELKVGEVKDGRLWPRNVRPAQIGWHRELYDNGGDSRMLIGVPNMRAVPKGYTEWDVWHVYGYQLHAWKDGYLLHSETGLVWPIVDGSVHDALAEAFDL